MLTYNQIIKSLNDIADNHLQINSFQYDSLDNIATSGTIYYPMMFVLVKPATVVDLKLNLNFTIIFCDLVHKGETNMQEVESDMLSIALDVIHELQSPSYTWSFDTKSPKLDPFGDRFDDEVTGWSMDITLGVPKDMDRCSIPNS